MLLLLVPLAGSALYLSGAVSHALPLDPSLDWPPEFIAMQQLVRQRDAFPQSVITLLDNGDWVAWSCALVAAILVGSEFAWGTVRTTLVSAGRLEIFFAVRAVAVLVLAASVLLILAILGAVLPNVVTVAGVGLVKPPPIDPLGGLAYAGAWFVAAAVFTGIGMLMASATRSVALGLVLSVVYVTGENAIAHLPALTASGRPEGLAQLLPVQSTIQLVRQAAGLSGRVDVSAAIPTSNPFAAGDANLIVPVAWAAAAIALAVVIASRSDVHE